MATNHNQKHEFAVFVEQVSALLASKNVGDNLSLENEQLYHRIVHVLRLQLNETVVIFDECMHAHIRLVALSSKKKIEGLLIQKTLNPVLVPKITVLLPILKREAFEEAIYSCVELGATEIQLVTTHKTQRSFGGQKELQRLHNVMVAAAEQSKQFALPVVHMPAEFGDAIARHCTPAATAISCDLNGQPFSKTLNMLMTAQSKEVVIIVGPEGDFIQSERDFLVAHQVILSLLTPTVLRTQQALVVALGAIRATLMRSL